MAVEGIVSDSKVRDNSGFCRRLGEKSMGLGKSRSITVGFADVRVNSKVFKNLHSTDVCSYCEKNGCGEKNSPG